MKAKEVGAVICFFILLSIFIIGVGNAVDATIQVLLTDDWRWSVKAIHFLLIAWLSWKALTAIEEGVEDERDS